jgi:hypothetical protein
MLSFRSFILENKSFVGTVYHGTNARFDKFDQRKSRIVNDNYGGGIAYFTDALNLAITYARNMAKKQGGDPIVYSVELKLNKLFDVDHEFAGKELVDILSADVKEFARGAGLLGLNADEYKVISNLKTGNIKLTGEQVYRGLSKGNTQTAKARDHLIEKGYDGLRYNMPVTPKQSVYLAYNANSIKIIKRQIAKQKG